MLMPFFASLSESAASAPGLFVQLILLQRALGVREPCWESTRVVVVPGSG
jgi:hypothetical protein